ncbi:hypothetical protein BG005_010150 [Podila minutissima]|nr:hypothetical protein BG005_010150 [Podila minutissima]
MVATRRTTSTNKDTSPEKTVRIKKNGKSLPVPTVHIVNATNPNAKKTSPSRKANLNKNPESLSKDTSTSKDKASQPTRKSSRRSGSPPKDEETIVALEITSIAKLAIQSLANAVAGIDIQEQKTQPVVKAEISTPLDIKDSATAAKATGDSTHQVVKPSTEPRVGAQGQKRKYSRTIMVVKAEEDTLQEEEEKEEVEEAESDENIDYSDRDGDFGSPTKRRQSTSKESAKPVKMLKAGISDYERERLENIKRNQEMLQFLQLPATSAVIQVATLEGKPKEEIEAQDKVATPAPKRIPNQRERKEVAPLEIGENDTVDSGESRQKNSGSSPKAASGDTTQETEGNDSDEENPGNLMSGDLFFDKETRDNAIRVDGHYKGWIHPEVLARYGFEKSAQDAWQAHGGGTFSFKDPLGDMNGEGATSLAGSHLKSKSKRPKHDARMVSKAMFKKNPNAYFYRHNEPGQEQWTGDWTLEEREIFLQVAREHGCGDKWGLFASHIPHRVGYQCSNFYRQVVLPEGLVFDPNYEYTSRGKPIYCGKYNQRRS